MVYYRWQALRIHMRCPTYVEDLTGLLLAGAAASKLAKVLDKHHAPGQP